MQQRHPELNRRLWPFALQVGVVLTCTAFVESPRLQVGLQHTLPFALGGDGRVQAAWIAASVVAGILVAVVLGSWRAWRRLTGVVGGAAAAALAVVLVCGVRGLIGHAVPSWLLGERAFLLAWSVSVPSALLALLAGPVLREHGAFTVLWVSTALGVPLVLAQRQALAETVIAEPIAALEAAAPDGGELFLALPEATPRDYAFALSRSISNEGRQVLVVPSPSPEESWLRRAGWRGLAFEDGGFEAVPALPREEWIGEGAIRVRVSWTGHEAVVRAAPVSGIASGSVITPAGVVRFYLDEGGHGTSAAIGRVPLGTPVEALPSGTCLRFIVVSGTSSSAYGWQDVKLP